MTDWLEQDLVATGGAPTVQDLKNLSEQGFKAIIDLRADDPDPAQQQIPPSQERALVYSMGMQYSQVPIVMDSLDEGDFNAFRTHLNDLPAPVYVHCAGGKRALLLTLMDQAIKRHLTGAQALHNARAHGLDFTENPRLATMIERYINRFIV
jgi:uncharacterized protein (TIGR01244 family)